MMMSSRKLVDNMIERQEYTSHNFEAYNAAVNNQLETQRELIAEAKSRKQLINSKKIFYFVASVSMVICAASFICWLLTKEEKSTFIVPSESGTLGESSGLKQIADGSLKKYGVDTSYTVFKKTVMASGENIVTAKEYNSDSLEKPVYQYCYLDSSVGTTKTITTLAILDETGYEVSTKDQRLIQDGIPLCQFQD